MIHNKDRKISFVIAIFTFLTLIFCCSAICEAAGTKVVWDESPESNVEGYYLYYGTESENYTDSVRVVGKTTTSYLIADFNFTPSQTYYIAITPYTDTGVKGIYSNKIIYEEIKPKIVTDLQSTTHTTGECSKSPEITVQWSAAVDIGGSGLDGYSIIWDTKSDTLPDTTKDIEDVTTATSSSLSDGSYYFHIRTADSALNWSDTAEHLGPFCIDIGPPPDTIDTTVTIAQPTSADTYITDQSTITLSGTALDNVGITSVTWQNDRGGNGTASGTTSWTISNVSLQKGDNVITVTTHDAAGNTSADMLTVTYIPHSTYTKEFGSATGADYPGTLEDAFININEENSSTYEYVNTYTWPQDKVANAVIMKWDLSAIPSSATIQDATLYLYLGNAGGDDLYDLTVHKIIHYNPVISACTGYTYDGTNSWTPNTQCNNNIPLAQADITAAEDAKSIDKSYGYKSWTVTNMAQDWISDSATNYGMLVNSDPVASSDSYRYFSATESSNPDQRPKLVVIYSVVEDVTPPADVSNFTAIPGDGRVILSWTNPADSDFVGTIIRYRTDGTYPANHTDGTPVDNGNDGKFVNSPGSNDSFDHTGLQNGTSYYYSAFTYDEIPNYSEIAHVSAKPTVLLAPTVTGTTPTNDTTPTWTWTSGGGGNGTFRYKLDNSDLTSGATETTNTAYTPSAQLSEGSHTLYVQEQNDAGDWSNSGSYEIVIDITPTDNPVITTDGGSGPGNDYSTNNSSITLNGTCAEDTVAIYVNGSTDGVNYTQGQTSWTYAITLESGDNIFDITAEDAAGNVSDVDSITVTYGFPIGGYSTDYVIPSGQVSQSTNGDGVITIHFKIKDTTENTYCTLHTFEYSVDSGENWNAPDNDDNSESLSGGWPDNDGSNYSSATDFDSAKEHSFTFNTQHQNISGLDGEDQSDVQVRFTVNDGAYNSLLPVTSEDFRVDNLKPSAPTDVERIQ